MKIFLCFVLVVMIGMIGYSALAKGALGWLFVSEERHAIERGARQEKRAAVYTASEVKPTSKIKVEMPSTGCVQVFRVDVDPPTVLAYAKNNCHQSFPDYNYQTWHWNLLTANKTIIATGIENFSCGAPTQAGDSAECHFEIPIDDRATMLRVWLPE